jgi:hypothetical protein
VLIVLPMHPTKDPWRTISADVSDETPK